MQLPEAVAANRLWYHTLELAPDLVTPGWFDLRPIVERMPWPDVAGLRCLDVGTYDGFLAFELERRGAAEVVATDIAGEEEWDWYPELRDAGPPALAELMGPEKGRGFRVAAEALGSAVERVELSVYDLDPDRMGQFDVVVCGSLLLHLRDPLRALEAIRTVCRGHFLSAEEINLPLSLLHPRRPLAALRPHELAVVGAQRGRPPRHARRRGLRGGAHGRPLRDPLRHRAPPDPPRPARAGPPRAPAVAAGKHGGAHPRDPRAAARLTAALRPTEARAAPAPCARR